MACASAALFAQTPLLQSSVIPSLGAPYSFTKSTTVGVFGTEVDDFMDVHGWKNVNAEKFFGYAGYDMGAGGINLGFSKQLAPLYFGLSFDGKLGKLESHSISNTVNTNKSGTLKVDTTNTFTAQALFGFGILGLRAGLYYRPVNVDNSTNTTSGITTVNKKEHYYIFPELTLGFNMDAGSISLNPWARLGLQAHVNKETSKVDGTLVTLTDSSQYDLVVALGTGIDLAPKENVKQSFDIGLSIAGGIIPGKSIAASIETIRKGKQDTSMKINLGYKVKYQPVPQVALGLNANLPIGMRFISDVKKIGDVNQTYNKNDYLVFTPNVGLGAEFWVKPEKFRFNLGIGLSIETFGWNFNTNVTAGGDKTKDRGFLFNHTGTIGDITWGSGFTWNIAKKVQFDVDWKIINGIFKNFTSNFNEGDPGYNGSDRFWGNVNKLLVHNISFLVAVKL
ncbi:MAG: hypothetical protein IJR50_04435 [Treponema sp.]|nr:hypothetical protein [Treponema sp.]